MTSSSDDRVMRMNTAATAVPSAMLGSAMIDRLRSGSVHGLTKSIAGAQLNQSDSARMSIVACQKTGNERLSPSTAGRIGSARTTTERRMRTAPGALVSRTRSAGGSIRSACEALVAAAREAYSLNIASAAAGANEADGPFSAACRALERD